MALDKDDMPRIRQIQSELQDIDIRQKNLLQELFTLMGIKTNSTPFKTSRNRLTKEQFRRLCGA